MIKTLFLLLLAVSVSSANQDHPGKFSVSVSNSGHTSEIRRTYANEYPGGRLHLMEDRNGSFESPAADSGTVRWVYTDPAGIAERCAVSGNGRYNVTGWMLNNHRISVFRNNDPVPLWEYPTGQGNYTNYVAISDTGGVVAAGTNINILLFNNSSPVPFFNFDLTRLPDTGLATNVALTRDGSFLIASASRTDSSTLLGFNSASTTPVWTLKIRPTITVGGAFIQGIRISANDSFAIANTYAEFFVINTFTGQVIYSGLINPSSTSSGTQAAQGISGDGSVIATINYSGILRVYQKSGATYTFLWQNQEPPGQFFNWYTSVDITDNGEYIAAGTLNFITSSSYDGKVKLFKKSGAGVPQWTYAGCGDEVAALDFSGGGNMLAAASWGDFNGLTDDLYIFRTAGTGIPSFTVNSSGSFFTCGISADGRIIVAGGKAVHARQFGSGGLLYSVEVDTSGGPTSVQNGTISIPAAFRLEQNYPNPFNPSTMINVQMMRPGRLRITIHDIGGRLVRVLVDEMANYGLHSFSWNAAGLPSGPYICRAVVDGVPESRRMMLLK